MKVPIGVGSLVFVFALFMCWLGGIDFGERGPNQAFSVLFSAVAGLYAGIITTANKI